MPAESELDRMVEETLAENVPTTVLAWLDGEHEPVFPGAEPEPVPEPVAWEIDGERTAEWVARRLMREWDQLERAAAEAARLHAVADQYLARVRSRRERHVAYFEGRLKAWHDRVLAENPKAKTIDLPSGKLERRAGGLSTEITDTEALVAWLEDERNGAPEDALEYPDPKPCKTPLKAAYAVKVEDEPGAYHAVNPDTGEIVPGLQFVRAEPTEKFRPVEPEEADGGA